MEEKEAINETKKKQGNYQYSTRNPIALGLCLQRRYCRCDQADLMPEAPLEWELQPEGGYETTVRISLDLGDDVTCYIYY